MNRLCHGLDTQERTPSFPLHILEHDDGSLEVLDGWEVLHAALQARSKSIQLIFYQKKNIRIKTHVPGFYYVNFAGPERRLLPHPGNAKPREVTTIPTDSYAHVANLDELPDIPELDSSGMIKPGYDLQSLEAWFFSLCETKSYSIYQEALEQTGGDASDQEALLAHLNRDPIKSKFFYYFYFFQTQGLQPGQLLEQVDAYPAFAEAMGQPEAFYLSEQLMVQVLMDFYRQRFDRYYAKFLFAGANAVTLGDVHQTPYGRMSGVNVIINAFNTLITENSLTFSLDFPALEFWILLVLCLLFALVYGYPNVWAGGLIFGLLFLGTFVATFAIFNTQNLYIRTMPLLLLNIAVFASIYLYKMFTEQRDKRFLKAIFSTYLSPELIEQMHREKIKPRLGGEQHEITAFFTDIQAFSTFAEQLTPEQLVELLNEYFAAMTNILKDYQGTLDKYEGDAIIAFFGAPMQIPDNGLRACQAALAMQRKLAELNAQWSAENQGPADPNRNTLGISPEFWEPGKKWPKLVHCMKMRIGINTGKIVVGNIGSSTRMNYTMMGDAVNLASRLEGAAKLFGVSTLVSGQTLEQEFVLDNQETTRVGDFLETRFLGFLNVPGKNEVVRIYELLAEKGDLSRSEEELIRHFEAGMTHYLNRDWDQAIACFEKSLSLEPRATDTHTPSRVLIERCRNYRNNPPAAGSAWDGVFRYEKNVI